MKFFLQIIILVLLVTCKYKNPKTDIHESSIIGNKIDREFQFEVIMDVVVKKNDKFHLFYKDLNAKDYSANRVLEKKINGIDQIQTIIFLIPAEVIPTGLRIDFGINYSQEPIALLGFKIRYDKNEFDFNENKFEQLFRPNKFVNYNEKTKLITTTSIQGQYDPNFESINLEEIVFSMLD
ncbi:hypothetical protein N9Q89_02140 [Flavobacteriaceae bacterium]|jgi:hypothetical protein|nr:hypothetical protein [Flavobacteriaceae bacterium]